jgi:plasmid stabilization system protein ParE
MHAIQSFIAVDNPHVARKVTTAIRRTLETIAAYPAIGRAFRTSQPDLRETRTYGVRGYPTYIIYYTTEPNEICVERILHSSMDAPWHLGT